MVAEHKNSRFFIQLGCCYQLKTFKTTNFSI
jgi:hypothetical protein